MLEATRYARGPQQDGRSSVNSDAVPLFDFGFLVRVLRRRMMMIVVVAAACLAVGLAVAALTPNEFESGASILLDSSGVTPFGNDSVITATNTQSNPFIESQIQVVQSRYLLAQVVDQLGLDQRPEFMEPAETRTAVAIREQMARLTGWLGLDDAAAPASPALEPSPSRRFETAVDKLQDRLSVSRSGLTQVLRLRVTTGSATLSAEIVNAVAQAFVDDRLSSRQTTVSSASDWFEERIGDLQQRATEAEAEVARYRTQGDVVNAGREGLLSEQQVGMLASQLDQAQRSRLELKSRLDRLVAYSQQAELPAALPADVANEALTDLGGSYSELLSERAQFAQDLGEDHAATQALDQQLAAVEARLRDELGRQVTIAAAELEAATLLENDVSQALSSATDAANDTENARSELTTLQSEATVYRQLHDTYLQGYLQATQQQTFPYSDARILSAGVVPEFPAGPSTRWTLIAAGIIGLSAGMGLSFVAEFMDRTVRTRARLAHAIGAPVLGILPPADEEMRRPTRVVVSKPAVIPPPDGGTRLIRINPGRQVMKTRAAELNMTIERPLSTYGETVRRIKVAVDEMGSTHCKMVGFISSEPAPRRSVLALNYAEMLALGGSNTLLIDADWYETYLTSTVTPDAAFGLANLLGRDRSTSPEHILWFDERTGLYFLPNRGMGAGVSLDPAVFDIDRIRVLLNQLSTTFDNIVIDFSSLAVSADAAAVQEAVTGFVVVALWGKTPDNVLTAELARSGIAHSKIIGGVLDGTTFDRLRRHESVD